MVSPPTTTTTTSNPEPTFNIDLTNNITQDQPQQQQQLSQRSGNINQLGSTASNNPFDFL